MKGREGKGPPSADLLVCFPSRAYLTLMPKPICSPARAIENPGRHHHNPRRRNQLHPRKSSTRGGGGHASPLYWPKTKPNNSDISEPTSPKVTCAGQIKVRPKPRSCKNVQSLMEELERMHYNREQKKRHPWIEALGFKKEVIQFLACLRNIRFDFRCFGSFPSAADVTSDDEEEDDDDDDDDDEDQNYRIGSKEESIDKNENSRAVFSKWFMILQENNQGDDKTKGKMIRRHDYDQAFDDGDDDPGPCAPPPPNALLLMRCRSAPAKSWLEERGEEEEEEEEGKSVSEEENERQTEETERKENVVVMRCGTDFSKLSSDIAKETWIVGGIKDVLSRSRSWKR